MKFFVPKPILASLPALFCATQLQSQLTVFGADAPPYNPQNLISNVFLGSGVDVANIQFGGVSEAVGYFEGGSSTIGIDRGIVLTTGLAESTFWEPGADGFGGDFASSDNGSGATDADLAALTTAALRNVSVYTITFTPTSDTLRFRYCFASEEYPEYGCSLYNDVFGFFIQGPGYPSPTNIAKIPGTDLPVTINNIHPVNPEIPGCGEAFIQYFNTNYSANKQPVYDGFTDVFTAMAVVQPCQQYTIKLAIADVQDRLYDSGVFLEAKSFGTSALTAEVVTPNSSGIISEGCAGGTLTFKLPAANTTTAPVQLNYNIWGTATNGVDYQPIPSNLSIAPGQTQVSIPLVALPDGLTETGEFIAIDLQNGPCRRDTIYIYIRDNSLAPNLLRPDTSLCVTGAVQFDLDGTQTVPALQPKIFTNTQDVGISPVFSTVSSSINVFGVQPAVLGPGVIRSVCLNITHPNLADLDLYLQSPDGVLLELSTDNGGSGNNYVNTCFVPSAPYKIPLGSPPYTGNFMPEGNWADLWALPAKTNGTWKLRATDDAFFDVGTLNDWSITFEPAYKIDYQWFPANAVACATCPKTNTFSLSNSTQTYRLRASDSYGCAVEDSVTIQVGQTIAAPTVTCTDNGPSNITFNWGTVAQAIGYEVNINGAGWQPAPAGNQYIADGLAPGTTLELQIRSLSSQNLSCPATISTAVCQTCSLPVVDVSAKGITCFGMTDGSVLLLPDGQNPPYIFQMSGQVNASGQFIGLAPGSYSATVTDTDGCQTIENIVIENTAPLAASASVAAPISCAGLSDGSVLVAANGGSGTLNFAWSNGQSGATAANLPAGIYLVNITDSNGCSTSAAVTLPEPPALALAVSAENLKCFGQTNGSATAIASGGTGILKYSWSNGQNALIATNLSAGNFTVTVTDANGCTQTKTATVSQPAEITASATAVPVKCSGGSDGTATANATGGTGNFKYLWSDSQTTAAAANLPAGNFSVTITDSNGCTNVQTATVGEPAAMQTSISTTDVRCFGAADGTATANATGGFGTLNFAWSNGQHVASASNLPAGNFSVTIADSNGCTVSATTQIAEPEALKINATSVNARCFGEASGSLSLVATGGTAPYLFAWASGETSPDLTGKLAGNYTATVTDAHGCTATLLKTIAQPAEIQANFTATSVKCFGDRTGTLQVGIAGEKPPFALAWAGPEGFTASDFALQNLPGGMYALQITDAAGCQHIDSVEVEQPAPLGASCAARECSCFGLSDGQLKITGEGGTWPYRFSLDGTAWGGSSTLIGLKAGMYAPHIMDKNGCRAALPEIEVPQRPQLEVNLGTDITILLGQNTQLFAEVTNAVEPVEYNWSAADGQWLSCLDCPNPSVDSLFFVHQFEVVVVDSMGCTAEDRLTVHVEKPRRVSVPTGFSPNGDLENDRLLVHGQKGVKIRDFRVFDRWGELLWQAENFDINDPQIGWDGMFRGQPTGAGVFVWVLEVEYMDGVREVLKGNTMLVR